MIEKFSTTCIQVCTTTSYKELWFTRAAEALKICLKQIVYKNAFLSTPFNERKIPKQSNKKHKNCQKIVWTNAAKWIWP